MEKIGKAGLTLLIGFIIAKAGGGLFKFIAINQFSPEVYGELAIFLVLFNIGLLLSTFSITIGVMKFVSESKGFYISGLIGSVLISLVVAGALILTSPVLSEVLNIDPVVLVFLGSILPLAVIYNITVFYFRGIYKMKKASFLEVSQSLLKIITLLFFVMISFYYPPYTAFLFTFIILDILFIFSKDLKEAKPDDFISDFKKLLLYSLPVFIAEISKFLAISFDRLILSYNFGAFATGIYDFGITLCIGYMIVANSYGNAILPKVSENMRLGEIKRRFLSGIKPLLGLFAVYTLLLNVLDKFIINLINPEYIALSEFIYILSLGYIFIGLFTYMAFFLKGLKKQKLVAYSAIVLVGSSVMLNIYFIPMFKYIGAGLSIMLSALIGLVVLSYFSSKVVKLKK